MEEEAQCGGTTPTTIEPKLYHDIQTGLSRLVAKASQLIDNETTNLAEPWIHIRSKFDGGKEINRYQSGSWEHRCLGAGLQQNYGKTCSLESWKQVTESDPNTVFEETVNRSAITTARNKKRKEGDDKAKRRSRNYARKEDDSTLARLAYSRHDGGVIPHELVNDVPSDQLEELKSVFYNTKVVVSAEEVDNIKESTIEQAENQLWIIERRKRITASNVGSIAKMRATTKRSGKVKQLLYSSFRGNAATRYGTDRETVTRQKYVTHMKECGHPNMTVRECGMFISAENPWLAASPDGIVDNCDDGFSGLLKIKNPYSEENDDIRSYSEIKFLFGEE